MKYDIIDNGNLFIIKVYRDGKCFETHTFGTAAETAAYIRRTF